jgi:hypothetical protein
VFIPQFNAGEWPLARREKSERGPKDDSDFSWADYERV